MVFIICNQHESFKWSLEVVITCRRRARCLDPKKILSESLVKSKHDSSRRRLTKRPTERRAEQTKTKNGETRAMGISTRCKIKTDQ
ncbi:hypothetical protein T4E_6272 [Trichinella pseudospiralis]|uniref:Uncharacterized protein n=1 Tax=Trichinella pseudospiralis TaxID=6337 RepID=A0A0V0XL32_TRIPS|nr:hypothetical protein T4E_6272 [Trichinella pseudospiralis]